MSAIISLSSQQLRHIAEIKEKIDSLEYELSRLINGKAPSGRRKFGMSAAGRARIAAAQRARWAKVKRKKKPSKTGRKMNAAAKAKIAAAARARWARAKAAGRNRL